MYFQRLTRREPVGVYSDSKEFGRVKRVPNQYHLSVLAVLLRALALPSVPQNQRDALAYADWQS